MGTADQSLADLGTARPLTHRDLADPARGPAGPADLVLVLVLGQGLADPGLAVLELVRGTGRGDLVDLGLAVRDTGRVDLVEQDPADRVDLPDRVLVDLAVRERGLDLADRGLADQDLADRAELGPADLAVRERGLDLADRGLAGRDRPDGGRGAHSIGVMIRWVVPPMRLAASVHATTVRHRRRKHEDSAGTMGPLPVGRRVTGSVRRLRVVGMVLRLPVVGTIRGTGRTAA